MPLSFRYSAELTARGANRPPPTSTSCTSPTSRCWAPGTLRAHCAGRKAPPGPLPHVRAPLHAVELPVLRGAHSPSPSTTGHFQKRQSRWGVYTSATPSQSTCSRRPSLFHPPDGHRHSPLQPTAERMRGRADSGVEEGSTGLGMYFEDSSTCATTRRQQLPPSTQHCVRSSLIFSGRG
jgi:hypothetical protein